MTTEARLEELLLQWEDQRRQGRLLTAGALCADCPELTEELGRRIKALEAFETVGFSTNVDASKQTSDAPPVHADPVGLPLVTGMSPMPGYRLLKRLGRGGFGEVWEAMAPGNFRVALKFVALDQEKANVEVASLDIVRTLRHPNLLSTFGAWQQDERLIIAMELADRTLMDRFREAVAQGHKGIPRDELLEYFREAANGIDYLNESRHTIGDKEHLSIQHRDIKPQNILLVGSGVKLADFGLVRFLENTVTGHTGNLTPMYAAPEFFHGQTSSSSDQYCLAMTYCHLRGGDIPFGTSHAELIAGHMAGSPDLSMLPVEERPVVRRALAKKPAERWPTCREFVKALAACVPPPEALPKAPRRRSKRVGILGALCLVVGLAVAYAIVNRPAPSPDHPKEIVAVPETKAKLPNSLEAKIPVAKLPPKQEPAEPPIKVPSVRVGEPELIAVRPALVTAPSIKLIAPKEITLAWGEKKSFPIQIVRYGAEDVVRLSIKGLPAKVAMPIADMPVAQEQTSLELIAALDADETQTEIVLHGAFRDTGAEARIRLTVTRPVGQIRSLSGHKGAVRAAAFLPDGRQIVSAGDDGCVVVWDLESSKEVRRINAHTAGITGLAVADDGRRVLTSSLDHTVRVWDLTSGKEVCRFEKHPCEVECVALSPDGRVALSGDRKAGLWLWDAATGQEIRPLKGAEESIWSVAFTADGQRAYSGGYSRFVRVWDVDKGTQSESIDIGLEAIQCVVLVPGKAPALVAAGEGKNQSSIQVRKLQKGAGQQGFGDYRFTVGNLAISKTGRQLLSAGSDKTARLWNAIDRTELYRFDRHQGVVFSVAFSPNGRTALSASRDETVRLWALPVP